MAFEIDARVGGARTQFAQQAPPEEIQELIDAGFQGKDSQDFYEGLLAGFANSYSIFTQVEPNLAKQTVGSCIAHIAKFTIR